MSLFLYRLGHGISRYRVPVVIAWILILVAVGCGARHLGTNYDDSFSIPGTSSQQGQDLLSQRFPEVSGGSGQLVFTVTGGDITSDHAKHEVEEAVEQVGKVPGVRSASDPFASDNVEHSVSTDGRAALSTVQFDAAHPSRTTKDNVQAAAQHGSGHTVQAVFSAPGLSTKEGGRATELVGIGVAFLVLVLTFGSFLAAGIPLITAVIGVLATTLGIAILSNVVTINSTSPTLAEMLGLAVGIDYALFILHRYRTELRSGAAPREGMARALGTSGTAVVFAGLTVIIALLGLSVANIPFLSTMGAAGAAGVAIAVVVALTLIPAIALILGRRLIPKPRRTRHRRHQTDRRPKPAGAPHPIARRWVGLATRLPALTVAVVVLALGVCAMPLTHMSLALPDNSTQPAGSPQREAFDEIAAHFGPGYNAPLIVTADLLGTTKPQDAVTTLESKIKQIDGVTAITEATPNSTGDTALLRVIPAHGQNDPRTADLVMTICHDASGLEHASGAKNLLVTGTTASDIDVSARLGDALIPFVLIVVGLSIVLLMLVFRSIAIPIKAALGYLLSVGASLGAVVAGFQFGWFGSGLTGSAEPGPIVSFLPIIVMGVLFGLAMDYEMFLVSRMREHYVKQGDPRAAIDVGFQQSAPVVVAAATIMLSVFAAFIPNGTSTIRPIAFGLAVGVAVDAFVVRMTLVPAVLALLGRRAWALPRWLDRILPHVDAEGAAIDRRVEADALQESQHSLVIARGLQLVDDMPPMDFAVPSTGVSLLALTDSAVMGRTLPEVAALTVAGRRPPVDGLLVVDGSIQPEESGRVLRHVALADLEPAAEEFPTTTIAAYLRARVAASVPVRRRRTTFGAAMRLLTNVDTLSHHQLPEIQLTSPLAGLDLGQRLLIDGAIASAAGAHGLVITGSAQPSSTVFGAAATLAALGLPVVIPMLATDIPGQVDPGLHIIIPRLASPHRGAPTGLATASGEQKEVSA